MYCPNIIDSVRKEGSNCDTCQRTKRSNKKYGKLKTKLSEEITWKKIFVDIIGTYIIRRKGKKEDLHLKAVTIIDPVIGRFEIAQYNDKNRYLSQS